MGWLQRRRRGGYRGWQGKVRGDVRVVPFPDGDTIPTPGYGRWVDLMATRELPVLPAVDAAPLLTPGQAARAGGRGGRCG
jgi:hypothetical protein